MIEVEEDLWSWLLRVRPKILIRHQLPCAVKPIPQSLRSRRLFLVTREREDHLGGNRYRREVFVVDDDWFPGQSFPFHPLACNKGGVVVM